MRKMKEDEGGVSSSGSDEPDAKQEKQRKNATGIGQ